VVAAHKEFFAALKGVTDPEEKREAIIQTFYRNIFGRIVKESGAKHLLQGTILTDVDETVAGIKRQHNVFEQIGIDPQQTFGYQIETVRKATVVVEQLLKDTGAFQYMAILHEDRVTGMRNGKRDFGQQIEVRCWDSIDARTATPTKLSFEIFEKLAGKIIRDVPGIVSVTYNITSKPPSTIEAV
jgi:GMP synthase (glutamine-hydrolysing)